MNKYELVKKAKKELDGILHKSSWGEYDVLNWALNPYQDYPDSPFLHLSEMEVEAMLHVIVCSVWLKHTDSLYQWQCPGTDVCMQMASDGFLRPDSWGDYIIAEV